MSSSVVVRVGEKGRGEIQTYITVRIMCALLFFFLQDTVLAAAFVRCKVRSPHLSLLHSITHTTATSRSRQTPPPLKTNKHVNLGSVGHDAMQPVHNMCLSDFPSDYKPQLFNIRQKRFKN